MSFGLINADSNYCLRDRSKVKDHVNCAVDVYMHTYTLSDV